MHYKLLLYSELQGIDKYPMQKGIDAYAQNKKQQMLAISAPMLLLIQRVLLSTVRNVRCSTYPRKSGQHHEPPRFCAAQRTCPFDAEPPFPAKCRKSPVRGCVPAAFRHT